MSTAPGPWRPRRIDVVALLGFGLLWLVPMAYVGYLGGPPVRWAPQVRDLYAVSCLFGDSSERVSMFYVQVRYADRPVWRDLPEHEFFRQKPFGHRTRFDRFMARFGYYEQADEARRDLALWLAARHAALHPEQPRIVALRYLWANRELSSDDPPQGRWTKPPRAEAGRLYQLGDVVWIEELEETGE